MLEKNRKVLIIDTNHEILIRELTKNGFQCDYFEGFTRNDYHSIIGNYFGVIIRSKIKFDKEILEKAKNLKFIGRVGAGMENIDVDLAKSLGITCFNAPEGNRDAVGEHTLGMLLMLMNKLLKANREVRNGIWLREENRGLEIKGKTIGIIGYGNMGSAFSQRLSGFEANVIAYDKYKSGYSDEFVKETNMEEIYSESDILSMHVPLTDETRFLLNNEYFNNFKKNIFVINTSRGNILKTDDLVNNLKTGKILGAALDVLEYEKLSFENIDTEKLPESFKYLIASDKVVLSPHIAGWTIESKYKLAKVMAEKIINKFGV
ncbi:MAG: hypothetical protein JEY97_07090 [Bacteroidales bacterium]|nr:hypothetical protein [Bacteroidales bacterium]